MKTSKLRKSMFILTIGFLLLALAIFFRSNLAISYQYVGAYFSDAHGKNIRKVSRLNLGSYGISFVWKGDEKTIHDPLYIHTECTLVYIDSVPYSNCGAAPGVVGVLVTNPKFYRLRNDAFLIVGHINTGY